MFFFRAVIIFILFKIGSSYVRKVVFLSSSISRRRIDTYSSFPSSQPSWGLQIIQQHGNTISSYNRNFNDNRNVPSKNRFSKGDKSEVIKQVDKVLAACKGHSSIKLNGITEVNHAIVSAGRLGRTEDAIEIFRSLKGLGFSPDLMSFNNVIWCAGHSGKLELSKKLFKEMLATTKLKPNVYTYGSLIHACAKAKNYKQALLYLDHMYEYNIVPYQIVFTSAMEACAESGQYQVFQSN